MSSEWLVILIGRFSAVSHVLHDHGMDFRPSVVSPALAKPWQEFAGRWIDGKIVAGRLQRVVRLKSTRVGVCFGGVVRLL